MQCDPFLSAASHCLYRLGFKDLHQARCASIVISTRCIGALRIASQHPSSTCRGDCPAAKSRIDARDMQIMAATIERIALLGPASRLSPGLARTKGAPSQKTNAGLITQAGVL